MSHRDIAKYHSAMTDMRDQDGLSGLAAEATLREDARQTAYELFRHLVEQSPFGVYAVDAGFRLVQVSAGAQKVFANVRPLLGRDFAEVLRILWPEPFATEAIGHFRHTLATGERYQAPRTVEQRRDIGEVESYDWKIERVMLPDGRFGVVCHFYDLSERQQLEDALRRSEAEQRVAREQLEDRVRERTRELLDLSASRQQLLDRLVTAAEEERQRIARELHDEMGQHITALRVRLEALPRNGQTDELKYIITRIDQSIDRLTLELRPPTLDQLGLYGAITSHADEFSATSGIRVALHLGVADGERFPDGIESALYRVMQESLTNVWKHASATTVSVILERHRDVLRMIIEDDGRGFEAGQAEGGAPPRGRFGLLGMRERVAMVAGTFKVESEPGNGVTIYVGVPLPRKESGA